MRNKIEEILANVKEKDKQTDKTKEKKVTVSIQNCSIINKNNSILLIISIFCLTVLGSVPLINKESLYNKRIEYNEIEENELKELVYKVSICEKRHVNSIHSELKYLFNYRSYKKIDNRTYSKVKKHLTRRLCD